MAEDIGLALRGPKAYALVRDVLADMERDQVSPTPLNLEIWLTAANAPNAPLAAEINRLKAIGQSFTDAVVEKLAARFLSRGRLRDEVRDTGDKLNHHLQTVLQTIAQAQKSNEDYGRTLAGASETLDQYDTPAPLKALVNNLTTETRRIQGENSALEARLNASNMEVRQLREHLEQVRRDSLTDALTNVANRKAFDEALHNCCAEADKTGIPLSLAVVDVDHFKKFNDTWGHQTGDQVLRYVASVLARLGAAPRLTARYGGEEFAIIFPGETADVAAKALDHVRKEIASRALKRRSTNEDLGSVTVSMGVAQRMPGEKPAGFIERADMALYDSKHNGRNRVTVAADRATAAAA